MSRARYWVFAVVAALVLALTPDLRLKAQDADLATYATIDPLGAIYSDANDINSRGVAWPNVFSQGWDYTESQFACLRVRLLIGKPNATRAGLALGNSSYLQTALELFIPHSIVGCQFLSPESVPL